MLCNLWPRWKPNTEELRLWGTQIRKTRADASVVMAAIDEARASSHFNAPTVKDFLDAVAALGGQSARAQAEGQTPTVATGVWVICLADDDRPGHVGSAMQIVFASAAVTPPPDRISQIAHAYADRCAEVYGGEWAVLLDHTPGQVHQMAWAMKHGDEAMPTFGKQRTRELATAFAERERNAHQQGQPENSTVRAAPRRPESQPPPGHAGRDGTQRRVLPPPAGVRPAAFRR